MEIQRADRELRNRIFLGVLLAAVAGVVGLVAVQNWLSELLRRPPAAGTKQATLVALCAARPPPAAPVFFKPSP